MFDASVSRLALLNEGTHSESIRYLRATSLEEALRFLSMKKLSKAAFVVASLVFAGGVFAAQANATVTNSLPNITSAHPQQSDPTPSPAPT
jgi:hypothetical protein